jgi:hypothetical protein
MPKNIKQLSDEKEIMGIWLKERHHIISTEDMLLRLLHCKWL